MVRRAKRGKMASLNFLVPDLGGDIRGDCALMANVRKIGGLLLLLFLPIGLEGQDLFLPVVENESLPGELPFGGNQPVTEGDDLRVLVEAVSSLVVTTEESSSMSGAGVSLRRLTVENQESLQRALHSFLNRDLTEKSLLMLTEIIVSHYEENDLPVVDVWVPPQAEVATGTLVVRILEGKVGQVQLREPEHFNPALLAPALRMKRGEVLRTSDLTKTTAWLSRNPFRKADLFVAVGSEKGEADLVFAFEEQRSWQVFAAYENTGTRATGENRFLLGGVWGNAFQQDHVVAYQATLGTDLEQFQAHGLSWEVPLHRRHEFLRFTSSWARVASDSTTSLGRAEIEGSSFQLGLSYGKQWFLGDWQGELSGGLEIKRSDTFLTFSDFTEFTSDTPVEVAQLRLDALLRKSATGPKEWNSLVRVSLFASPGGLSGRNEDSDFAAYRAEAEASYFYLRGSGQWSRAWKDWLFLIRAEAQLASGALLPSEQLALGGLRTVRGYQEREFLADSGWWGSAEARTPAWSGKIFDQNLSAQGLLFLDHGFTWRENEDNEQLLSAGLGARVQWGKASLRADLGVPLIEVENGSEPRAHVGLTYRW